MEEYICEDEGISVRVTEEEGVCPNCGGDIIDVNTISVSDWRGILIDQVDNLKDYPMKDIDDYLKVIKEIKKLGENN